MKHFLGMNSYTSAVENKVKEKVHLEYCIDVLAQSRYAHTNTHVSAQQQISIEASNYTITMPLTEINNLDTQRQHLIFLTQLVYVFHKKFSVFLFAKFIHH
jgi:hypothetical protein